MVLRLTHWTTFIGKLLRAVVTVRRSLATIAKLVTITESMALSGPSRYCHQSNIGTCLDYTEPAPYRATSALEHLKLLNADLAAAVSTL